MQELYLIYHGSNEEVEHPEIRKTAYAKDFGYGFYCTNSYDQAKRWAQRHDKKNGVINIYSYIENESLNIKKFPEMNDEWLDFIADCRSGKEHSYDIVEGPMADDTIWNYVNDYLSGDISREAFWLLAKFKHPTHQISFNTPQALECITYKRCEYV